MTFDLTDIRPTITPKGVQLNADDLIGGPRTVIITAVEKGPGADQPLAVRFDGDDGRPYLPCKTMRKLLVFAWGEDATRWAGRALTLYCDPTVKFGGQDVGGIRISHMTHIEAPLKANLVAAKGKKAAFVVHPLVIEQPAAVTLETAQTVEQLRAAFKAAWKAATGDAELQAQHKARYDARLAEMGGAA
jgi:hypothetical protein